MSVTVTTAATGIDRSVRIYTPGVGVTRLPWLPSEISVTGLAGDWQESPRPGRAPVLRRAGLNLTKYRVPFVVTLGGASIRWLLVELAAHAAATLPTTLLFAAGSRGILRVTELSYTESDWDSSGDPIKATVDMTLTTASDASVPVGPVPKPKKPHHKPHAKPKRGKGK